MRNYAAILISTVLYVGMMQPAGAAEIYRWVGSDGVVHYSDEKPRTDERYTTLQIEDSRPADYDPHKDPYSIQNQAKRINESWSALAQARADETEQRQRMVQTSNEIISEPRIEIRSSYYSPWLYSRLAPLNFQRRVDPRAAQRQFQAIEGLNLSGPRPASINSGVHRERVQRSTALPVAQ